MEHEAERLRELLHYEADIDIRPEDANLLVAYLDAVYEANATHNLTRIPRSDASILQLYDSLLYLRALPEGGGGLRLLDIGTGAGFPGVPLSVVLGCESLLIDSVRKKVDVVRDITESLDMRDHIHIDSSRAEDLARGLGPRFDVVVARAVADTSIMMEYATPLLVPHGSLVLSKAPLSVDEEAHAELVADELGLSLVSRETFELPHGKGTRVLLRYDKTGDASIALPRRTGMATKRPLYLIIKKK